MSQKCNSFRRRKINPIKYENFIQTKLKNDMTNQDDGVYASQYRVLFALVDAQHWYQN